MKTPPFLTITTQTKIKMKITIFAIMVFLCLGLHAQQENYVQLKIWKAPLSDGILTQTTSGKVGFFVPPSSFQPHAGQFSSIDTTRVSVFKRKAAEACKRFGAGFYQVKFYDPQGNLIDTYNARVKGEDGVIPAN